MVLYSGDHKLGIIHFIGIGGIGISGIAEVFYNLGYIVQGSDINFNNNTKRLSSFGIKIFIGHDANNINDADYVVISSAVSQDNIELIEASKRKIPILKRYEILAELMKSKYSIGIGGSHGKTTTTSLIGHLFESLDLKPTVIVGGILSNKNTNAYVGSGKYLVAEADESDGTFIEIFSTVAVVTNIDKEHVSFYKNFENLKAAFKKFITKIPFYGFSVVCYDDPVVKELVDEIKNRKIIKYGIKANDLNVKAVNIKHEGLSSSFDIEVNFPWNNKLFRVNNFKINIPGLHNILNSLAAISIAIEKDFEIDLTKKSLESFKGVNRRFTKLGEYNGAIIIDDYAHHPEEIKATLNAAKLFADSTDNKIVGIFQPHRYSRSVELFDEFITCFSDASKIFISEIYAAGEQDNLGIDNLQIIKAINLHKVDDSFASSFLYSKEKLIELLDNNTKPGDIVIFMGAGSITNWAYSLFEKLS
jgi:UDP-N-acetylmuramate--alanine ligase